MVKPRGIRWFKCAVISNSPGRNRCTITIVSWLRIYSLRAEVVRTASAAYRCFQRSRTILGCGTSSVTQPCPGIGYWNTVSLGQYDVISGVLMSDVPMSVQLVCCARVFFIFPANYSPYFNSGERCFQATDCCWMEKWGQGSGGDWAFIAAWL